MSALHMLTRKAVLGLQNIARGCQWVLRGIFGSWQWDCPPWLKWIERLFSKGWAACKRRPKTSITSAFSFILLCLGSYGAYQWYLAQPKPAYPHCNITAPPLTTWPDDKINIYPLIIDCDESVAPLDAVGKAVPKGVDLSPKMAGSWQWETDRKLVFTPSTDWPVDQDYALTLAKQKLFAAQIHLENYQYSFKTAAFVAQITNNQFYQDPRDPALKKLVATVQFSHSVNPEEFEQHTQLSLPSDASFLGVNSDATGFSVTYDKLKHKAFVHSHSLTLPRENVSMTLTLKQGIHAARGGNGTPVDIASNIIIPGRFSLTFDGFTMILADNEKLEPEQVLLFNSLSPVPDSALAKHITAWVLPEQHPDTHRQGGSNGAYHWNTSDVDKKALAKAEPLTLKLLPSDDPNQLLHSYQFLAPVGRYIYLEIAPGVVAIGGTQSAKITTHVLQVKPYERSLKLMGNGAILGLNGERKIGLVGRAIDGVKLEVGRLLPNQLHQLLALNGGGFSIPSSYSAWDYSSNAQEDRLVERFTELRPLVSSSPGKPIYGNLDLSEYFSSNSPGRSKLGVFLVRASGLKNQENSAIKFDEHSYADAKDSRLLLVTDLGIIIKTNIDGSQDIFVQSISKGEPVAGATVALIGRNGLTLETLMTDSAGRASLAKMSEQYKREKTPLLILVQEGEDLSFLPLHQYERRLNLSRFDIGGTDNNVDPNTLNSFLFSDRGIYRPGEEIHLGTILRTQDWKSALEGIPLEAEITDPRGMAVHREKFTASISGFNELHFQTQASAPTGTYSVSIYLVKAGIRDKFLGSTTLRVQEFEPDRLKVTTTLAASPIAGWIHPDQVVANVAAMNLFGTPATDRRVTGELTLSPALPSFAGFSDYRFYDPSKFNDPQVQTLPESKTDDKGQATFDLNLARFAKATYKLALLARVFEAEGGRNVAAFSDVLVSTNAYLVGIKKADADLTYLQKDSKHISHWLAVNPKLHGQAVEGLTLEWIQRKYVSVLMKQDNGTYRYQSRLKETLRDSHPQNLAANGTAIALLTEEPGDFAFILRNSDGQELNRLDYSVVGQGNLSRSLEHSAELQIKLNKSDYVAGDTIELAIQAPYIGAGLITIERDKVYNHVWFKTSTTSSVQHIQIPEGFEGNGYVTVQFVRALGSDEVFTSPLSYGVMPFKMSLAPRTQSITLKAPELIKPGETLTIQLTVSSPSKAVVYAIDEGILQVARYKTPDPLGYFFQKRRLDVESSQILDLILPEFSQLLNASAPGGDGDGALARNLNPFKNKRKAPAVYWSGLVDVGPEATHVHYKVPDYFNGKLHLFAIAVNAETVAVSEAATEVRGDLILSPNLPVMLAPGDEADVSFGIANNLKSSQGPLEVHLKTSAHVEVIGNATLKLDVAPGKEGQGSFRVRAKDVLGAASLNFTAMSGKTNIALEEGLSVRPPVAYRTSMISGRSEASPKRIALSRTLYDPFRKVTFSAGYTPIAWAKGLQQYLDAYPYSCTEQLVSMGIPGLLFSQHPELGQLKGKTQINDVLQMLASRQNDSGAFGMWSASSDVQNWPSLFAIQFMIEAQDRRQPVPNGLFQHANSWLQQLAQPWGNSMSDMRQRAYAVYLLSRQGIQTGSQLGSLQQELKERYPDLGQTDIAAAYVAASQRLLQQTELAQKTLKAVPWQSNKGYEDNYYDPLSHQAQLVYLYAKHFPELLTKLPDTTLDAMGEKLSNREYSSLSAAYLLLALTQYGEAATQQIKGPLSLSVISNTDAEQNMPASDGLLQLLEVPLGSKAMQIKQDTQLPLFYSLTESGFDHEKPNAPEVKNGLEIQRDYININGGELKDVVVGQEFLVRLRIRAIDQDLVEQIAVVDLLPGGVEPVINRAPAADPDVDAHNDSEQDYEGEREDDPSNPTGPATVAGFSGEPGQTTWHADFADLRDDRLVIYGSLSRDMVTFTYRVRATNTGTYQTPAAYAEAMYKPTLYAKGKTSRFTVVKAQ